jgi:HEAT repeat protein
MKLTHIANVGFFWIFFLNAARCNEQLTSMSNRLDSSDVTVRRSAAKELAVKNPEKLGNDALPLIQKGLKDPDVEVRRLAAAAIYRVAHASTYTSKAKAEWGIKTNPHEDTQMQKSLSETLVSVLTDTDVEVRENAVQALASGFPLTPEAESAVTRLYDREPSAKSRSAIVDYLVRAHSSKATDYVLKGLTDPSSRVRGWAADALMRLKPQPRTGLDILVARLDAETEPFTKQKFITAIGVYEQMAAPHLPKLRGMLSHETDNTTKSTLAHTIARIENPGLRE